MKKTPIIVALLLSAVALLPLQSCIGKFALTSKVMKWNHQVGSKFINELVFFAFWVLPVYEVTSLADLLVLNSIEFWSGNNPVEAYVKTIETEHGKYLIASDITGYTITLPTGENVRLEYADDDYTWSVKTEDGQNYPFMTMIDRNHVKMITPAGDFRMVELSEAGLQAYVATAQSGHMASHD